MNSTFVSSWLKIAIPGIVVFLILKFVIGLALSSWVWAVVIVILAVSALVAWSMTPSD